MKLPFLTLTLGLPKDGKANTIFFSFYLEMLDQASLLFLDPFLFNLLIRTRRKKAPVADLIPGRWHHTPKLYPLRGGGEACVAIEHRGSILACHSTAPGPIPSVSKKIS